MGDRANAVAELQRCLRIDPTCQAARTLLDAVATVDEQVRDEKRERGATPQAHRVEQPRQPPQQQAQPQRAQAQVQRAPVQAQPQQEQAQPQRVRGQVQRVQPTAEQRARYEYVPPLRTQPQAQVQPHPQPRREEPQPRREEPQPRREEPQPRYEEPRAQPRREPLQVRREPQREPMRAQAALQPLAHAVPRPVPSAAAAREQAEILSLFEDDAEVATDVKKLKRPTQRPQPASFDPLGIAPSGPRSVAPQPRVTFEPQPMLPIAPLPLPPLEPPQHAHRFAQPQPQPQPQPQRTEQPRPQLQPQQPPRSEPRLAVDPPHRRRAERPSRPAFDPPSTPPRRATAADSAPFVLPERPRRASTSWQRPLSIESRRPPLSRPALIAVALVAVAALWLVRPSTPTQLPAASLANAAVARPAPEPPIAKAADKAPPSDLVADVWIHPLSGPSRRMPIHDSRLFGAERLGDRPSECRGGHCGIDLAGAYGEPVYAVHDGIIDRVQRAANEDHGGHYVRIAHNEGTVISQYFHLSSIPRRLQEGAPIKAGDLVGWVGLSGIKHSEPHLHFTISVQDPSGADGRYLDPEPLVALWPLRLPPKGDDKLHLATSTPPGLARGFIRRRHHHHARNDSAVAAE